MLDLLITNAHLPDGRTNMSVAVQSGKIVDLKQGLAYAALERWAEADQCYDRAIAIDPTNQSKIGRASCRERV